ncbi:MAG: BON domain-containing protein [Acidobacteriia bacterium]|nr:BON domain-containing protein [Terriglobia bacterium]
MKRMMAVATLALLVLLSMSAMAATPSQQAKTGLAGGPAGRYDQQIQQAVSQKIHEAKQLQRVNSSVEDGIVTLTGTVDLYQDKLAAAKKVKKLANVNGVRNEIAVAGETVPDGQLQQKLAKKLAYDRSGFYDSTFNYLAIGVKDGVVTVGGATYNDAGRDSALAIIAHTPGVKDVVNEAKVLPASIFDDDLRVRTARVIYRDSVLGRYATDPVNPIRIVVDNGHVTLYGTVQSTMDKNIAGIRAGSVPGVFSVENKLVVDSRS